MDQVELAEFRVQAQAFLEQHASRRGSTEARWGHGPDTIALLDPHGDEADETTALAASRAWRRTVFDSGFGWLGGPTIYGGAGRDPRLDEEYRVLEREFVVPDQQAFATGTKLVAPALLAYGSDELRARHLRAIFRGDVLVCQLLSEPEAGSDLAGLRARAVRDGDDWIVTGQKVWTSQAHLSEIGQLLVRTDPDAAKHRGITMFLIDMDTPGITVRPLRQMTGESHFNEVFFDEARIPDSGRVGAEGAGWNAVMETFAAERLSVGTGANNAAVDPVQRLVELARHLGHSHEPLVRQAIADVHARQHIRALLGERLAVAISSGAMPAEAGSLCKLLFAEQADRCGRIAGELLGPSLAADTGEWGTFAWSRWLTGAPMMHIAGGTDEIQRNVLAERLLGLPREPRP